MKKFTLILSAAAMMLSLASCRTAEQMAKEANKVAITCNPSPIVVKGGQIDADLDITYPKN